MVEPDASGCELVKIGRVEMWMASTAQVIESPLISHDEEDVLNGAHEFDLNIVRYDWPRPTGKLINLVCPTDLLVSD